MFIAVTVPQAQHISMGQVKGQCWNKKAELEKAFTQNM